MTRSETPSARPSLTFSPAPEPPLFPAPTGGWETRGTCRTGGTATTGPYGAIDTVTVVNEPLGIPVAKARLPRHVWVDQTIPGVLVEWAHDGNGTWWGRTLYPDNHAGTEAWIIAARLSPVTTPPQSRTG